MLSDVVAAVAAVRERFTDVPLGIFATQEAWEILSEGAKKVERSVVYNAVNGMPVWVVDDPLTAGTEAMMKHRRDVLVATAKDGVLEVGKWSYRAVVRHAALVGRV